MTAVEIKLAGGGVALIDGADLPLVSRHRWNLKASRREQYARTKINGKTVYLHRLIMRAAPGQPVDHIDCDGLNCRRANLRFASISQNCANQRLQQKRSGGFKGVHRNKLKWQARIGARPCLYLGSFATREEAAKAYDAAAVARWGVFARLNFPAMARA